MRPLATIQVDIDSFWTLLRFYGYESNIDKSNTIYEIAIPRIRQIFKKYNVKATFFVIGKDLEVEINRKIIRELIDDGHEIANHTMTHPYGFSQLSKKEKEREIRECEELIYNVTGSYPMGFKAPGWDIDSYTIDILEKRGYKYDSSVFPSYFQILYKVISRILNNSVKGSVIDKCLNFLAPVDLYYPHKDKIWKHGPKRKIVEIPLTVTPYLRLPFYANFHLLMGQKFFDLSYQLLKGKFINYSFHAIELVDLKKDKFDQRLSRHPNINLPLDKKISFYEHVIDKISKDYELFLSHVLVDNFLS